MNIREFKEKLNLPNNNITFSDQEIIDLINEGSQRVTFYLPTLKECIILYEASRKINDTENMKYYKQKLLGKLSLI